MKFTEFLEEQTKQWPGVNQAPGNPGHIDLMRSWNTQAQMHPEMCEDIIHWPAPVQQGARQGTGNFIQQQPTLIPNPWTKSAKAAAKKAVNKKAQSELTETEIDESGDDEDDAGDTPAAEQEAVETT